MDGMLDSLFTWEALFVMLGLTVLVYLLIFGFNKVLENAGLKRLATANAQFVNDEMIENFVNQAVEKNGKHGVMKALKPIIHASKTEEMKVLHAALKHVDTNSSIDDTYRVKDSVDNANIVINETGSVQGAIFQVVFFVSQTPEKVSA